MTRPPTKIVNRLWRRLSPKSYCKFHLTRDKREWEKKLQEAKALTALERQNLLAERDHDLDEWYYWLTEIEDTELVRKAKTMDVHLEDIPVPHHDEEYDERWEPHDHHWRYSTWYNVVLRSECRAALRKAMRERAPAYRRERREIWDLRLKAGALAVTGLTGLIGAIIGLLALWKK